MCRRYVSPDQISIEREFDLVRSGWKFPFNFNTAPGQEVPVIRVIEDRPDPLLLSWNPANMPVDGLRLDEVANGLLAQSQRCIIPAMGFYQWRVATLGAKVPFFIHCEDQDMFGFAGLWERDACTILTLPGEQRMPAILTAETRDVWLYGSVKHAAAALRPYPDERLIAYAVGERVNSLDNNDESLIEPLQTNVD